MKTHTVPIITNGPLCGEACPWLLKFERRFARCLIFNTHLATHNDECDNAKDCDRCFACRHVTERAEALL